MDVRTIEGQSEEVPIEDTDIFAVRLPKLHGRIDHEVIFNGKELKRFVELFNTFNKIQDNPSPLLGFDQMLGLFKNIGIKGEKK